MMSLTLIDEQASYWSGESMFTWKDSIYFENGIINIYWIFVKFESFNTFDFQVIVFIYISFLLHMRGFPK